MKVANWRWLSFLKVVRQIVVIIVVRDFIITEYPIRTLYTHSTKDIMISLLIILLVDLAQWTLGIPTVLLTGSPAHWPYIARRDQQPKIHIERSCE
jgi:hypothetical protein